MRRRDGLQLNVLSSNTFFGRFATGDGWYAFGGDFNVGASGSALQISTEYGLSETVTLASGYSGFFGFVTDEQFIQINFFADPTSANYSIDDAVFAGPASLYPYPGNQPVTYAPDPTPEPGTLAIVGLGLVALFYIDREFRT